MVTLIFSQYPFLSFGFLLALITLLTVIDKDVKFSKPFAASMWASSALGASAVYGYRGVPLDVTAEVAAWVYLGAIVGAGFRPGLITRLPFADDDGKWLHYANLYILTGWVGVLWAGFWALAHA